MRAYAVCSKHIRYNCTCWIVKTVTLWLWRRLTLCLIYSAQYRKLTSWIPGDDLYPWARHVISRLSSTLTWQKWVVLVFQKTSLLTVCVTLKVPEDHIKRARFCEVPSKSVARSACSFRQVNLNSWRYNRWRVSYWYCFSISNSVMISLTLSWSRVIVSSLPSLSCIICFSGHILISCLEVEKSFRELSKSKVFHQKRTTTK